MSTADYRLLTIKHMRAHQQHLSGRRPVYLLFLFISLFACKETPDPAPQRPRMYADFFVRYLAPEQQIRGQVSFWEGLDSMNIDPTEPGGIVSFEGQKMIAKQLPGNQVRFSETHQARYEEPIAFRFRNLDDKYLQYELKMTPIRDFFVKGKISKQEGATFVINGGVMSKEESIVFLFTNERNEAQAVTFKGPSIDVEISLTPEQLAPLSLGDGRLYLVKKQHKKESHSNLELTAAVEYYTESREVLVEE